ncbi:MAG: leucine-rich repeat domain-containing protein [Prevotella sp.]
MKKLNVVLSTILLNVCLAAQAYDFEAENMYFNIVSLEDLTCEVTYGDINLSGDIVIPSHVVYKGRTLTVVGMAAYALGQEVTSVKIPSTIVTIKDNAFHGCGKLKHIELEDGNEPVKPGRTAISGNTISYRGMFCYCPIETMYIGRNIEITSSHAPFSNTIYPSSLKNVTLGPTVTSISCTMFHNCSGLNSLTVLGNLQTVNSSAFYNTALSEITLGSGVTRIPFSEINYTKTILKIISMNATPPVIFTQNFSNNQYINATVLVPPAALTDYQNANIWKDFWNIQGDESTGIETVKTDGRESAPEYIDLQGRKYNHPVKGINIVGGKKVVCP